MDLQVGALTAALGLLLTPLVLAAYRWAPAVGRPAVAPAARPAWLAWPVVAAITGLVLGVLGARIGADPALPAFVVFGLVAVVLALVDGAHHRLPDVLTLPSYVLGAALLALAAASGSSSGVLLRALAGTALAFAVYAALYLISRSGIGAGDVKYAGVVGMHAAWVGWGPLTVALVGGFVVGALVSVTLLMARRVGLASRLPFGPAMVIGGVTAITWGDGLARAWLGG